MFQSLPKSFELHPLFQVDGETIQRLDRITGKVTSQWSIEEATRHFQSWTHDMLTRTDLTVDLVDEIVPLLAKAIRQATKARSVHPEMEAA